MSALKPSILVIDDEPQIRKFLKVALEAHGYQYSEATSGSEGLNLAATNSPDLVVLDLGLPDMDGREVLIKLREWFQKPIIILSVRNDDENVVGSLEQGASDYVRKPFSLNELLTRIKISIKSAANIKSEPQLKFGHLMLDLAAHRIFFDEKEISLSAKEYELLKIFVTNAGKVLTHSQILKTVWGPKSEDHKHYLRIYVGHLRQKIEKDPSNPQLIINEPGVGYRFGN